MSVRCAVGEWWTRIPRLVKALRTVSTVACMAQIGSCVFVALEHVGISVYDEDGCHVASWRPPSHAPEFVEPFDLAAAPTGELVVLHARHCIKVLRTDGTFVRTFGALYISQNFGNGPACGMVATPEGYVIVMCDRAMVVFQLSDGQCVHEWRQHRPLYRCISLCVAPGGQMVLAVNWDNNYINVFRVSDGQLIHRWQNGEFDNNTLLEMPNDAAVWRNRVVVIGFDWIGVFRWGDHKPLLFMNPSSIKMSYPRRGLVTRQNRLWVSGSSWELSIFDLRLAT